MRLRLLACLMLAALLAARCFAWAETDAFIDRILSEASFSGALYRDAAERVDALLATRFISAGALVEADLSGGPRRFVFVPPSGSVYDICVFPADDTAGEVSARLTMGGTLVAEGTGIQSILSERLPAGEPCELELSGTGRVRLEVARHALSRCFDEPLALDAAGDSYAKVIARPGDGHWYSLTPSDGQPLVLACMPSGDGGPALDMLLFDDSGRLLAAGTRTLGGACLLDFRPGAGVGYRLRVCAPEGGTGAYALEVRRASGRVPEAVTLSKAAVQLRGRATRQLAARVSPEGASGVIYWESSDPGVVAVSQDGEITGGTPGTAVVTAYAAGSVQARCRVEVTRVDVTGARLLADDIELRAGDDMALEWNVEPVNATDAGVSFATSPEGVIEVDAQGVLRAVGEGEAVVTLTTSDGGHEARAIVKVAPAARRYRALLVGEQSYAATVAAPRLGSANSVAAMRSMLGELSYGEARFEIVTRLDATRDGVLAAIRDAFAGASGDDVSLFYITCHGEYAGGMTCFRLYDGSVLTAEELRIALDAVPGQIILLVDCCGSGGVIGASGGTGDILRGVREVFSGMAGPGAFSGSRYRVLASASVGQESYRLSFGGDAANLAESDMATAFVRAVCDGAGWSIDRGRRAAMRADVDCDGAVTLDELYAYASRRVMWYLSLNGGDYVQTVQVSPEGDTAPLFMRTGR